MTDSTTAAASKPRVLVADDEQVIANTLAIILNQAGFEARAVFSGEKAVESLESVRVVGGKDVVNLVPRGARHKGFALDELRRGASCDAAVYVGDDVTDEDVFKMRRALRLLTVRVGAKKTSEAEYYLKTQTEVDALITALVELRPG